MSISDGTPVSRAQGWLDRCRSSDNPGFPDEKVRVGIGGSDAEGLYVGITFLPAGTNGVCLSREETLALEVELLFAADAIRRERIRAGLPGHGTMSVERRSRFSDVVRAIEADPDERAALEAARARLRGDVGDEPALVPNRPIKPVGSSDIALPVGHRSTEG